MNILNHSSSDNLDIARIIILEHCQAYSVRIYLFGSYARGNARSTSDIDIGILPKDPLPIGLLSEIREAFFESIIPVNIDLVDLSQIDEQFKQEILQDAIEWNG
ncbi:MAG: nucleotidyltransferase domain-containing protein [Thiomargarita sp.]|nr:nucleotidyltransferase domain-containing protein [Thiomargarita sp.]